MKRFHIRKTEFGGMVCEICGKKIKKGYFYDMDLYDQLIFHYSEKPKCSKCFKNNIITDKEYGLKIVK